MTPNYSGQNLRGRSFKRQNLEGANFSYADIRSADFSGAILRGANFSHAKAGLQKRWVIFLVFVSWVLTVMGGFLSNFTCYLISELAFDSYKNFEERIIYQTTGVTLIVIVVIIFVIAIRQGIQASLGAFFFVAIALSITYAAILGAMLHEKMGIALLFAIGAIFVVLAAVVVAVTIATTAAAVSGRIAKVVAVTIATATLVLTVIGGSYMGIGRIPSHFFFSVTLSIAVILFSVYISWRALKDDPKQILIRNIVIAFAAIGGTSFRNANLTDANFTGASLKSTDFRNANLTRTSFYETKKLDCVRPGSTYLQDKELCRLLVTGSCSGKDFNNQNLRGLNLSRANLANASFIGTDFYQSSLKGADLTGAILVRTQFESTDLTGATLTGACIEDWVVSSTTKLNGIDCKYVFMKSTDGDKRDKMPLKGEFKNDDFILFVQSILETIKLYHEREVNPKLALYVLQTLSQDYQCTLEIVKIEKRGESGAIIEVKIPGNFNQEKLKETYYEKYNQYLKLHMIDPKNQLKSPTNIENVTVHKGFLIGGSVSNSTVAYTIDTEGDTIMPEGYKQQFNNDLRNAQIAGGLVNADKVEARQIGGNIKNYTPQQRQNLAEAVFEIQHLLKQLQETNPTETETVIAAKAADEIKNNTTLKARVIGALKSGGKEAFKEAVDNPLFNILIGIIEGWQEG